MEKYRSIRKLVFVVFSCFYVGAVAQGDVMRTNVFDPNIKTLQMKTEDSPYNQYLMELNSGEVFQIRFDELSHSGHLYSYRLLHCNADWTLSNLATGEYLDGFPTANIPNTILSENTTVQYTHYWFDFPNQEMKIRLSGNYVLQVYEDNNPDKPVAQICFCVVEPRVAITGVIRGNTDVELNRRMQQLDFEVNLGQYDVRDVHSELKVYVRQNNRTDNEAKNLKPTYISASKLSYINNRDLIFEGGNEYHRFDISSVYGGSMGMDEIIFTRPYYDAFVIPNIIQRSNVYTFEPDVNGRYVVNFQESFYDPNIDGDYIRVHISLDAKEPFFDGQVYVGGELTHNLINENSRMNYDFALGKYFFSTFLKQGGYNYQFWFVPKSDRKTSVERVEGSFWQTGNEYTVYVYHRPWGGRYDKLVGIKTITSN